jgi:hypothetical protein
VVGSRNGARDSESYWGLTAIVGGLDELWALDAEPIPDEPFDWSGVEPRDREYVSEVLARSDACCEELLDLEYRTIARRILARVATRDRRPLRRSMNAPRSAAGLVWLATQASRDSGRVRARSAQYLWTWFGVSNASDRGRVLRIAAGLGSDPPPTGRSGNAMTLGDTELLHSRYRARLIARRDAIVELRRELAEAATPDRGTASDGRVATVITPRFGGSRPA